LAHPVDKHIDEFVQRLQPAGQAVEHAELVLTKTYPPAQYVTVTPFGAHNEAPVGVVVQAD